MIYDDLPPTSTTAIGPGLHPAAVLAINNPGKWTIRGVYSPDKRNAANNVGQSYRVRRSQGLEWETATRTVDDGADYGGPAGKAIVVFIRVKP